MNNGQRLYISMYHYTRDLTHSRYPRIKGMDVELFKQQIEYIQAHFNVVRMEDVIEAINGGKALPDNPYLFTFDDGFIDNYTYAMPILEMHGLQGSFYIPARSFTTYQLHDVHKIHYILASADINKLLPDVFERMDHYRGREFDYPSNDELFQQYAIANRFDPKEVIFVKRILQTVLPEALRTQISSDLFEKHVGVTEEQLAYELYLTEEQVHAMKRHGMFIGLHGYDHYWLGNLPEDKMRDDIDRSLDAMSPFIDRSAWAMNYPYGSYNNAVLAYIRQKGACIGMTTEVRPALIGVDDPLLLPRFDCNDFPPKSENYLNTNKHQGGAD